MRHRRPVAAGPDQGPAGVSQSGILTGGTPPCYDVRMKICRCGHDLAEHAAEGWYDEAREWTRPCEADDCRCERFIWSA